jgi:Cu(I)/Ag(I) efflux system membrane fusion protein
MFRFVAPVAFALFTVVVIAAGCNTSAPPAPATGQTGSADHDHAGHDHAGHTQDPAEMAKVNEALAKLSAEDKVAAEKQHACPVSDAMLGSMGAPPKVDVSGTPVFICCEGCRDKLLADSATYLAKLKPAATP